MLKEKLTPRLKLKEELRLMLKEDTMQKEKLMLKNLTLKLLQRRHLLLLDLVLNLEKKLMQKQE